MDFSQGPALAAAIPHASPATSLSYHQDGQHLFVTTQDSKLYVINGQSGTSMDAFPYLKNEKDGLDLVKATHHDYSVLTAGSKTNVVNYWSIYDNKLLR
jgi:WD40 repeat protein